MEAELYKLRSEKRPYLQPISLQELLAEKVAVWNHREREETELPQALVDLLLAVSANDDEWQSAIDLYSVIGVQGVLSYLEALPAIRRHFGTPVAAASAAVVQAKAKTTTSASVSVKTLS